MSADQDDPFESAFGTLAEVLRPLPDAPGGNAFRIRAKNGKIYYAYEFPHPSVAASVVLYDLNKGAFLLIKRSTDPFNGYMAFPGGFLEVGKEEIEQAAVRELFEEAGVRLNPEDLKLIDVRSNPDRDPRDHIFDIAYYAEARDVQAHVGEEISAFAWATPSEIDAMQLAFDHDMLWKRVKEKFLS